MCHCRRRVYSGNQTDMIAFQAILCYIFLASCVATGYVVIALQAILGFNAFTSRYNGFIQFNKYLRMPRYCISNGITKIWDFDYAHPNIKTWKLQFELSFLTKYPFHNIQTWKVCMSQRWPNTAIAVNRISFAACRAAISARIKAPSQNSPILILNLDEHWYINLFEGFTPKIELIW